MHDSHNYENQASNILKMEKRYETPLKQQSIQTTITTALGQPNGGQLLIQNGNEVQMVQQPK